jgi:hypothetical protein
MVDDEARSDGFDHRNDRPVQALRLPVNRGLVLV